MAGLRSPPSSVQPTENNRHRRRRPLHGLLFPRRFGYRRGDVHPEGNLNIQRFLFSVCLVVLSCMCLEHPDPCDAGMCSLHFRAAEKAAQLQPERPRHPAPGAELFEDHDAGFTAIRTPLLASL